MTYQFTQIIMVGILVVFNKSFPSIEEAEEWNERTKICPNFILRTEKEISAWDGEVITLPITSKGRKPKWNTYQTSS